MRTVGEWLMGVGYWLALPSERGFVERAGFRRTGGWILNFAVDAAREHIARTKRQHIHVKPNKRGRA